MPLRDSLWWPNRRGLRCFLVTIALLLTAAVPGLAQLSPPNLAAIDSSSVGRAPYSRMHTLLEKTLFQVDVATLDVWVEDEIAVRLETLVGGERYSQPIADSASELVMSSQDAFIRIGFLRDVSLDQFLDAAAANLKRVLEAGLVTEADFDIISAGMPVWYAFLEERGIRDGDVMRYRIRGDTLRTQFLAVEGELMLDQTDVGPERRRSVLGSYFVRGSDFREGLVKSLFGEHSH